MKYASSLRALNLSADAGGSKRSVEDDGFRVLALVEQDQPAPSLRQTGVAIQVPTR